MKNTRVCARVSPSLSAFSACAALDYKTPVALLYKARKSGHLKRCAVYGERCYTVVDAAPLGVCAPAQVRACSGGLLCKEGEREEGRSDLHFKWPV